MFSLLPPDGLHTLAYDGNELVSHAVRTTRAAQPEGHPALRTAYVDAVSTAPSVQGRGFASGVMRELAALADADGYEIACLETDRQSFYARLGWQEWRGPLAGRKDDGSLVPTPQQTGIMILRLPSTPALDLDAQLTIECQPQRIW